jgi:phospholipid:diacylglycerol acyltransferase
MIEIAKMSNHNRKVVLITHSMGGNVVDYFIKWVESKNGGNGGKNWTNDYIESIAHVAAPFLGLAKTYSTLLR